MFSLFRMVSYFWELGGDVLALYRCKCNLFGFPSPPAHPLAPPGAPSGRPAESLIKLRHNFQLNSHSLPSCGFILQQFSPKAGTFPSGSPVPPTAANQHSVFPVEIEHLPRLLFSCLQGLLRSLSTSRCHILPAWKRPSDCKFPTTDPK